MNETQGLGHLAYESVVRSAHENVTPSSNTLFFPSAHENVTPSSNTLFRSAHENVTPSSNTLFRSAHENVTPSSNTLFFPSAHQSVTPSSNTLFFPSAHESVTPSSNTLFQRTFATLSPLEDAGPHPHQGTFATLPERGDDGATEPATRSGEFIQKQMSAALEGTVTAFIKHALKLVADAHGFGMPLRMAEFALTCVKWLEVGEGHRQVDVMMPISLSSGVELDLSAQAGSSFSDSEPLITACFAPSSGPGPGVLVLDGCQISPGDAIDEDPADGDGTPGRPCSRA